MQVKRLVTLISGTGSNMQAILGAIHKRRINAETVCVISDRTEASGLAKARSAGIATASCTDKATLYRLLDELEPDVIALAGFMRILEPDIVQRFNGRILNIHPSLLPKYKGCNTHRRVLKSGDRTHGCSVHFVTKVLDEGPVVMQAQEPVLSDDTLETLMARVLKREHIIFPRVLGWYCDNRLRLDGNRCVFDGEVLERPLLLETTDD